MRYAFILTIFSILLNSCNTSVRNTDDSESADLQLYNSNKYALGFSLNKAPGYNFITVFNPWQNNDTLATYLITKSDSVLQLPSADFVLNQQSNRIAVLSSTCIGMFKQLGETASISAASDAKMIYDSTLYAKYLSGKLVNLGESHLLNTETVIAYAPDMVMKYIYVNAEAADQKMIAAGIPVVYNMEYMEPHPLGRSEWIKFVAAFVGKEKEADSIFAEIEYEYLHYSTLARKEKPQPTVMDGSSYKGVWYAAGGKSYPAKLYADAGADYYWKNDSSRGSIPLSIETMIDKQQDAEFWIGPSTGNKQELLSIDNRYSLFNSFQNNKVFSFGNRVNPNGGYDYFESGVVRPDILLKDLIWVFHPNLLNKDFSPVYIKRLD